MKRRSLLKAFALSATFLSMGFSLQAYAADTIKVGIMHSLSGTMAISETPLKDVALMTINEINRPETRQMSGVHAYYSCFYQLIL